MRHPQASAPHCALALAVCLLLSACGGGGGGGAPVASPEAATPATPVAPLTEAARMAAIVPLFDSSGAREPALVEDTPTALVTRFADRARDRHAREGNFHIYDHYLSWYWEQRTATVEIIDKVAKGGSEIVFNVYPQWTLSAPEFRAFFRGITTAGEYHTNISMARVGATPWHYSTTLSFNPKENRPIRSGEPV